MIDKNYTGSFSDEENEPDENEKSSPDGAEYHFEGFTIEFNEKILLTPVSESKK